MIVINLWSDKRTSERSTNTMKDDLLQSFVIILPLLLSTLRLTLLSPLHKMFCSLEWAEIIFMDMLNLFKTNHYLKSENLSRSIMRHISHILSKLFHHLSYSKFLKFSILFERGLLDFMNPLSSNSRKLMLYSCIQIIIF